MIAELLSVINFTTCVFNIFQPFSLAKLEQTKEELDRAVDSRTSAKEDATRQGETVN